MANEDLIRVEGLRDLQRAFASASRELSRGLKDTLKEAAEPVRSDAESLAVSRIRKIGPEWSRMRIGVTRVSVYVAPQKRGRRTARSMRRPNLKPLLLGEAMVPALEQNRAEVREAFDDLLADVHRKFDSA